MGPKNVDCSLAVVDAIRSLVFFTSFNLLFDSFSPSPKLANELSNKLSRLTIGVVTLFFAGLLDVADVVFAFTAVACDLCKCFTWNSPTLASNDTTCRTIGSSVGTTGTIFGSWF